MTVESFSKRDLDCLQTIIKYCDDIEYLTQIHGSDEEDFNDNISLQYGCVFSLIQIGEYVKRLSSELKNNYPNVNWKYAAGMRDFVVHNYADVNVSRIRTTSLNEIPLFKNDCLNILGKIYNL